jgi:hypothetical protein
MKYLHFNKPANKLIELNKKMKPKRTWNHVDEVAVEEGRVVARNMNIDSIRIVTFPAHSTVLMFAVPTSSKTKNNGTARTNSRSRKTAKLA